MPTLLPNRYAAGLAAVIAAGTVLHIVPVPGSESAFIQDAFNLGHVVGFAAVGFLLARWLESGAAPAPGRRRAPSLPPYLLAAVLAAGLAVGGEALQIPGPRDASLVDIGHDAAGAAAGLMSAYALGLRRAPRLLALAAAAVTMLVGGADPGASLAARGFARADRFNRTFEIGPEPRTVRIALAEVRAAPRDRRMDLSRIERTIVFMTHPGETVLYLDRLRLE